MSVLIATAGVLVGLPLVYVLWEIYHRSTWGDFNKLPGPTPMPLVGATYIFPKNRIEVEKIGMDYTIQYRNKYGAAQLWFGIFPVLQVLSPELNQRIMSTSKHTTKGFFYKALYPWLGRGLLTADGELWHTRRHLLTPTFHFSILNGFSDVMNEQANVFVSQLAKEADTGKTFDIFHYVTLCALDIIMETAMGVKLGAQVAGKENDYVQAIYSLTTMLAERGRRPWLLIDFIRDLSSEGKKEKQYLQVLHGFTDKVIKERRQLLDVEDAKVQRRLAFLDLILTAQLPDGSVLKDSEIREEVDTFMFEGHDTTSAAVVWTLYFIAKHPDVQQKLYDELVSVVGESGDITNDNAPKLKYLEMVNKEALRIKPSVPVIMRTLTEDLQLDDITIPAGCAAAIRIWEMHRDPQYWDQPEKFDPDRWLPDRSKNYHPYQYIPFSAGPRNCIGQKFAQLEDKTLVAKIVLNYRLEVDQDVNCIPDLILRPTPNMPMRIFKR